MGVRERERERERWEGQTSRFRDSPRGTDQTEPDTTIYIDI